MSTDSRAVATDALGTLGTIIDDKQKRDAIHLAVEPVVAGADLAPGAHIDVRGGVAYPAPIGGGLGIVDPFLTRFVEQGQRFWLVIYPRQINSLRHVWTHPTLPDEIGTSAAPTASKEASEGWLREFCASADCPNYERVMELIDKGTLPSPNPTYYENGGEYDAEYLLFRGSNAGGEIPPEFWMHAEVVLGRKLERRPTYFACSC